jgi:hypothetical protein
LIIKKESIFSIHSKGVILMNLKSGMLHEKHAVATWDLRTIYKTEENLGKPVARWPVVGPSGCIQTTSQQSGNQNITKIPWPNISLTCVPLFY